MRINYHAIIKIKCLHKYLVTFSVVQDYEYEKIIGLKLNKFGIFWINTIREYTGKQKVMLGNMIVFLCFNFAEHSLILLFLDRTNPYKNTQEAFSSNYSMVYYTWN